MKSILFSCLLFGFAASASVNISSVKGANAAHLNVAGVTTIFAGLAGPACGSGPCNSCAKMNCDTAPFCACNPSRISDDQVVTIQLKSNAKVSGNWALSDEFGSPSLIFAPYVRGQTQTLTMTWGQLCNGSTGNGASCEGRMFDTTLLLGISNGTKMVDSTSLEIVTLNSGTDTSDDCTGQTDSICSFKIASVKGGAMLENVSADQAFPGWIEAVRVYGSNKDFASASPTAATVTQDLKVTSEGTIKSDVIPIKDGTMTYFRVATVDITGNVYNFTSDKNIQANGKCTLPADADPNDGCLYRFSPQSRK